MIDDLVKRVLADKGSDWIGMLTSKLGFNPEQAEKFVPTVLDKVGGLIAGGKVDLAGGLDPKKILAKLDADEVAAETGVDTDKAAEGLAGLVPNITSAIEEKTGGADGLLSMLGGEGGIGGAVGKLGKLFG